MCGAHLSILFLTASLCGCGCLRSKAPSPAASEVSVLRQVTAPRVREARVASLKRWVWLALSAAAESGGELDSLSPMDSLSTFSKLFLGGDAHGCTEADSVSAERFITDKAERWFRNALDAMEPYLMNLTDPYQHLGWASRIATLGRGVQGPFRQIKREMPKSCNMQSVIFKGWPQIVTCAHQTTNISKPCIRCGSKLFFSWTSNCWRSCSSSLSRVQVAISDALLPLAEDLAPSLTTREINLEQQEKSMKDIAQIGLRIGKSTKVLVPCFKCSRRKATSLLSCLQVDETVKQDLDNAMKSIEGQLRDGAFTVKDHIGLATLLSTKPPVRVQ